MPRDLIDQETFAERSERLRSSLIAAQREYDSAVFNPRPAGVAKRM
jgi:hypothetical protein